MTWLGALKPTWRAAIDPINATMPTGHGSAQ
jgi:hypothetical protein